MTGLQFRYVTEQRLRTRHIIVGQKTIDHLGIDLAINGWIREDCLHFRAERKEVLALIVVKRLDSNAIPCQEKSSLRTVPYRECEHPPELLHAIGAVFLIQMHNYFSIRL